MTVHISLDNPTPEHRLLLSSLSTHISKSKRSVVVTGAGISCNAGIPVLSLTLLVQLTFRISAHRMDYTTLSKLSIPKQSSKEKIFLIYRFSQVQLRLLYSIPLSLRFAIRFFLRRVQQLINSFGPCKREGNWCDVIPKISMGWRKERDY